MTTTTTTSLEAKLAKIIYNNLTPFVVRASIHPVLSKLNLHNNRLLKKLNTKAKMVYYMNFEPDAIVKDRYERGGEDNIENALLTINELVSSDYHANHKEYIFKRINYLTTEALTALHDRNHQDWLNRINTALENARVLKKTLKKSNKSVKRENLKDTATNYKKTVKSLPKRKKSLKKAALARKRNKLGQFTSNRRKR